MTRARRLTGAVAGAVVLATAACGGDDVSPEPGADVSATAQPSGSPTSSEAPTTTLSDDEPFGPGCGRFRSPSGLGVADVDDKPTLLFVSGAKPLRDAFGQLLRRGLGDRKGATYFLPTNQAINSLPVDVRGQLVSDAHKARQFFGHHVVDLRLAPSQLDGEHTTVVGDTLPISVSGDDVSIGLQGAAVVCGNIETLDATIYVVDQAIMS